MVAKLAVDELILNTLVLGKKEHVVFDADAVYFEQKNKTTNGKLIFTQKRFFFVTVSGFFSKTANVVVSHNYSDIVGVSLKTYLFFIKRLIFSLQLPHGTKELVFQLNKNAPEVHERARELINQATREKTIEAKVVVNETVEDTPEEILKKKLARGEITTDEFHKRVQRM